MPAAITTIGLSGVNCYLLTAGDGFMLIDTGLAAKRAKLKAELARAGCTFGKLKLILLTHGDVDHAGNTAYLCEKFGAKIAMHPADVGMVEKGDMSCGRKPKPDRASLAGRFILVMGPLMERMRRGHAEDRFTPDLPADEGFDLEPYGLDAQVLHLPGHSQGSIGVLTAGGDLFCGDLLYNWRKPSTPIVDDAAAQDASIAKLRRLVVVTVYPGHGKAFAWSAV